MNFIKKNIRLIVQLITTFVTNINISGFLKGTIYRGNTKSVCVPGLNCYSCPGAVAGCPIGSLQATIGSRNFKFAFYVLGQLMIFGAFLGRFICGWLCPFGMVQDLLYKIPFVKKTKNLPLHKYLKHLKYIILALFVISLPMLVVDITGLGKPWFCEYICPQGTLEGGIPLVLLNKGLREVIGFLYAWKITILIIVVIMSIVVFRPFCKYLCPLGAFYGLFNRFALYRYSVNEDKCTKCNACVKVCPMGINVYDNPNSMECIRCKKCIEVCNMDAIGYLNKINNKSKMKG